MKDVPIGQDMQIIALQNPESDIEKLKLQSIEALKKGRRETTILVWPENKLHISYSDSLKAFVKNQNIFLVYNTIETASNFNTTIMLDPNGKEILRNYKTHKAP